MAHVVACKRLPVASLQASGTLPAKYFEQLEQNQLLESCCRHPENHDIEAYYSSETERWRGKNPDMDMPNPPDIYINFCTCGRQHRRFCVGGSDERPYWEVAVADR
jgi:hypothetical protein